MKRHGILLSFAALLLFACDPFYDADPVDPRLPVYSEKGENRAGAYINGYAWNSGGGYTDFQMYYRSDQNATEITFPIASLNSGTNDVDPTARISFFLNRNLRQEFMQNTQFQPLEIILDGIENYAELEITSSSEILNCSGGEGKFFIRHVSQNASYWIISGTFGFDINTECGVHTVYQGRFDFRVDLFQ
ncbi:MAG TPA: hypothetical protein VJ911_08080 [Cryomorphaceae bacterium]|nr:hypothetical protein [Cryomorphaceae bacterium]